MTFIFSVENNIISVYVEVRNCPLWGGGVGLLQLESLTEMDIATLLILVLALRDTLHLILRARDH